MANVQIESFNTEVEQVKPGRKFAIALDIQGFVNEYMGLVPKEVAWTTLDSDEEICVIVEPPYAWELLPIPVQIVNDLLTQKKHGLLWELPGITYDKLTSVYTKISPEITEIYVYDNKIAEFLTCYPHQRILTVGHCLPCLDTLEPESSYCSAHKKLKPRRSKMGSCARVNAMRIKQFVQALQIPTPKSDKKLLTHPVRSRQEYGAISKQCTFPEFSCPESRAFSFFNWYQPLLNVGELIDNGMFYSGDADFVQCFRCGVKLGMWLPGDKIDSRHRKLSPNCFGVKHSKINNTIIFQE